MTNAALPYDGSLDRSGSWEPRRQLTLEAARRRSQRLSFVRIALVAAASACFSAFFGFMTLHAVLGGFSSRDEISVAESLKMVNPRFSGRSEGGNPFLVTAVAARRQAPGSDIVILESPIYETEGHRVSATGGVYNQSTQVLDLQNEVTLADAQGNTFQSPGAMVNGEEGSVVGRLQIRGAGPLGSVRADSYEVRGKGDEIILRGNVKGVVNQSRRNGS